MKKIIKHFIIDTLSLYLVSQFVKGLVFDNGLTTLLVAGTVLAATTLLVKPVINILLLPLNLVTFGLFKWLGHAISLYIVTLLVPAFKILDFGFVGYTNYWFTIPQVFLTGTLAFICFSFLISIISSFISWIVN